MKKKKNNLISKNICKYLLLKSGSYDCERNLRVSRFAHERKFVQDQIEDVVQFECQWTSVKKREFGKFAVQYNLQDASLAARPVLSALSYRGKTRAVRLTDSPDSSRPAAPSTRRQRSSGASDRAPDVTPLPLLFRDNMAVVIAGRTGMRIDVGSSNSPFPVAAWVAATPLLSLTLPFLRPPSSSSSLYGDPLPSREHRFLDTALSQTHDAQARDASPSRCVRCRWSRAAHSIITRDTKTRIHVVPRVRVPDKGIYRRAEDAGHFDGMLGDRTADYLLVS